MPLSPLDFNPSLNTIELPQEVQIEHRFFFFSFFSRLFHTCSSGENNSFESTVCLLVCLVFFSLFKLEGKLLKKL